MRLLPEFIVTGVMRGGTTSLYRYLTEHPAIASTIGNEVHFFDRHYRKGISWYQAFFPLIVRRYYARWICRHDLITGESSPYYIFHPLAPRRVAEILPRVKLITLLRNPIDRAYSHYWLEVNRECETLSFEEAITCEIERLQGERERLLKDEQYYSFAHRHYSYLTRGIYVDQLKTWRELFPQEQSLILCSEDFYADPAASLRRVFEFLHVPNWVLGEYEKHNCGSYPLMDPATRKWLIDYFRPHNERLYEYLGKRFPWE
jgi:hypothetical protein